MNIRSTINQNLHNGVILKYCPRNFDPIVNSWYNVQPRPSAYVDNAGGWWLTCSEQENKSIDDQFNVYDQSNTENSSLPLSVGNSNTNNNEQLYVWQIEYYQKYFQIDTQQVFERLLGSIILRPNTSYFNSTIRHNPDLYGPFWICATFILTVAISGNIVNYFHQSNAEFQIDFSVGQGDSSPTVQFH